MSELFATKTRVRLLIDVADGVVITIDGKACYADDGSTVNSRIREMERAAWVEERPARHGGQPDFWIVTEDGEAILRRAQSVMPELFGPPSVVAGPEKAQPPYMVGGAS